MCTLPVPWCHGCTATSVQRGGGFLAQCLYCSPVLTLQRNMSVVAKCAVIRKYSLLYAPTHNDALFMLGTALEGKFALAFYAFGHSFWGKWPYRQAYLSIERV